MTAISTAINFIRIQHANEMVIGEPIVLDRVFIARIERLFEVFRQESNSGWRAIAQEMDTRFGYKKFIWSYGDRGDYITEMIFCKLEDRK